MSIYKLTAKVTISIFTEVEADSVEDAIEIAKERETMDIPRDSFYTEDKYWIADEIDGTPYEIEEA